MKMERKCEGYRYNFKTGKTEYCPNRNDCKLLVKQNEIYTNDGKERVIFKSIKDFRKCDLHK